MSSRVFRIHRDPEKEKVPLNAGAKVTEEEHSFVRRYGGGNVSAGLRTLIQEQMAREEKRGSRSNLSGVAGELFEHLDEAGARLFRADADHVITIEEAISILRPITRFSQKLTHQEGI